MLSQSSTAAILTAAPAAGVAVVPARSRIVELQVYNQTELLQDAKTDFKGECVGFSSFWLCLHMFNSVKTLDELIITEPNKLQAMRQNLQDVLLLSKYLGSDTKLSKSHASAFTLGVKTFSQLGFDAAFEPGPSKRFPFDDCDTEPESIDCRAKIFSDAVQDLLEKRSANEKYINFSYCWMDDVDPAADDMVHPQTFKRIQGHSIAFVKNPTSDCELLFFDSNCYAYAFSKAADFYKFAHTYFRAALGADRIPESFYTCFAKSISLKPAIVAPVMAATAPSSPSCK